jgi:hypothetical protein
LVKKSGKQGEKKGTSPPYCRKAVNEKEGVKGVFIQGGGIPV